MGKFPYKQKIERREGTQLQLKGERSFSPKSAVVRRPFPPGVHGPTGRIRLTPYGVQLREKQKVKRYYGLVEAQFRRYFDKAINQRGNTAVFLMTALEMRLDNVVYRLGFAASRRQARQMVNHGHFAVNGIPTNIPSYSVRVGDIVAVKENKRKSALYAALGERMQKKELPGWLTMNTAAFEGKVTGLPAAEELNQQFNPKLIIEFYSR